jgi:hypothetical protein
LSFNSKTKVSRAGSSATPAKCSELVVVGAFIDWNLEVATELLQKAKANTAFLDLSTS